MQLRSGLFLFLIFIFSTQLGAQTPPPMAMDADGEDGIPTYTNILSLSYMGGVNIFSPAYMFNYHQDFDLHDDQKLSLNVNNALFMMADSLNPSISYTKELDHGFSIGIGGDYTGMLLFSGGLVNTYKGYLSTGYRYSSIEEASQGPGAPDSGWSFSNNLRSGYTQTESYDLNGDEDDISEAISDLDERPSSDDFSWASDDQGIFFDNTASFMLTRNRFDYGLSLSYMGLVWDDYSQSLTAGISSGYKLSKPGHRLGLSAEYEFLDSDGGLGLGINFSGGNWMSSLAFDNIEEIADDDGSPTLTASLNYRF